MNRRAVCGAVLLTLACRSEPPPDPDAWRREPAAAALALVAVARDVDANGDRIDALFDPQDDLDRRAALHDALAALGDIDTAEVTGVEALDAVGRVAVDLTADIGGGGSAEGSVQFARREDGTLRVVWFAGLGVEWPARRPPGTGLSSSPPPG